MHGEPAVGSKSLQARRRASTRPTVLLSGERPAEPGNELGPPVAEGERQPPVIQHVDPASPRLGGGQLVGHPSGR
jgi:hypothetical protein